MTGHTPHQDLHDLVTRFHTVLYPLDPEHRDEALEVINHAIAAVEAVGELPDDVAKQVLPQLARIIGGDDAARTTDGAAIDQSNQPDYDLTPQMREAVELLAGLAPREQDLALDILRAVKANLPPVDER